MELLLSLSLLLAGCGGEASAADNAAKCPRSRTGGRGGARRGAPGGRHGRRRAVSAGCRPALPHKAPLFHNADAKRVLPSRLVIPAIKVDTPVVELGLEDKQDGQRFDL